MNTLALLLTPCLVFPAAGPERTMPRPGEIWIEAEKTRLPKHTKKVEDPDASGRFAARCNPADGPIRGSVWHSQATLDRGAYVLRLRMKVGPKDLPAGAILQVLVQQRYPNGVRTTLHLKGADFKTPGRYETVTVPFVRSPQGTWSVQFVATRTPADVWLDRIEIERTGPVSDAKLLLPNQKPKRPKALAPPPGAAGPILVARGPYGEFFGMDRLLNGLAGREVTVLDHHFVDRFYPVRGFPEDHKTLYRYAAVVLFNIGYGGLTPAQRLILRHYVEDGGALLIMGDPYGFSNAEIAHTFLEDVLPATLTGPAGPVRAAMAPVDRRLAGLDWKAAPHVYVAVPIQPKRGATVLVKAGDRPVLVVGAFGKGKVAVFTPSTYGKPTPGTRPFWTWPDIARLGRAALDRVLER